MAFNEKQLFNDEEVVIDLHPHWWYLTPRFATLLATLVVGVLLLLKGPDSLILNYLVAIAIIVALVAFMARIIEWRSDNFVVTTERCIYRSGVFKKTGIEIPLDRINTVFFNQTVFERMLKSGDIAIESASGDSSRQNFANIMHPMKVQNTIYQMMEQNDNARMDRIGAEAREAALGAVGATGGSALSAAEQLEKLHDLLTQGAITPEEYDVQKAQILAQ